MLSSNSSRSLWAAIALLSGVTVTGAASAQNFDAALAPHVDIGELQRNPVVRAAINVCLADRDRLCSGVVPGGGRIVRCLAARSDDLSPVCRAAMERASDALIAAGIVLAPDRTVK